MGYPITKGEEAIFVGNVAAHCKVMGHSTVSCAKTAKPIAIPFWMKTRVSRRNHVLDGCADHTREGAIFGGCPGHSKPLTIFAAAVAAASLSRSLHNGSFNLISTIVLLILRC